MSDKVVAMILMGCRHTIFEKVPTGYGSSIISSPRALVPARDEVGEGSREADGDASAACSFSWLEYASATDMSS